MSEILIADVPTDCRQVMCGMGRTGADHAWQQEEGFGGPDVEMVSKSLGGGFIPLSAVLLREKVVNAIRQGTGVLNHSQTFQVISLFAQRTV